MENNKYTELQLKHQRELREKREEYNRKKSRTKNLIIRGKIAERLVENAKMMSNEEFEEALYDVVERED